MRSLELSRGANEGVGAGTEPRGKITAMFEQLCLAARAAAEEARRNDMAIVSEVVRRALLGRKIRVLAQAAGLAHSREREEDAEGLYTHTCEFCKGAWCYAELHNASYVEKFEPLWPFQDQPPGLGEKGRGWFFARLKTWLIDKVRAGAREGKILIRTSSTANGAPSTETLLTPRGDRTTEAKAREHDPAGVVERGEKQRVKSSVHALLPELISRIRSPAYRLVLKLWLGWEPVEEEVAVVAKELRLPMDEAARRLADFLDSAERDENDWIPEGAVNVLLGVRGKKDKHYQWWCRARQQLQDLIHAEVPGASDYYPKLTKKPRPAPQRRKS